MTPERLLIFNLSLDRPTPPVILLRVAPGAGSWRGVVLPCLRIAANHAIGRGWTWAQLNGPWPLGECETSAREAWKQLTAQFKEGRPAYQIDAVGAVYVLDRRHEWSPIS